MGSISEPPEVLGHLIGGALVGTFSGILISYGFVSPLAAAAKATWEHEGKYLLCMKAGMLAHLQGYAPARSEEHTSELQSLMRISYAVFCLKTKKQTNTNR